MVYTVTSGKNGAYSASTAFQNRFTLHCQANEIQELEDLKKSKEQTEARFNIQISSLNENLAAARSEAEKFQQEKRETGEKLAKAEKQNDDLKGEVAGK